MSNRKLSWAVVIFGIIALFAAFVIVQDLISKLVALLHIVLGVYLLRSKTSNNLMKSGSYLLILAPIISLALALLIGGIGGALFMVIIGGLLYLAGIVLTIIGLARK